MNTLINQTYAPAEAERGKFVPIDGATITGYSSAGRGKYAVLTYTAGIDSSAISNSLTGTPIPVKIMESIAVLSAMEVYFDPTSAIYHLDVETIKEIQAPVSAMVYNPIDLGYPGSTPIPVSSINDTLVNMTYVSSTTIAAWNSASLSFDPPVRNLEMYNIDTSGTVYIYYGDTSFYDVTAFGIPIDPGTYYSIQRKTSTFIVANPNSGSTDVRLFGHYTI